MFGLDIRRSEFAGLIACEEDDPTSLLCVALKHGDVRYGGDYTQFAQNRENRLQLIELQRALHYKDAHNPFVGFR